MALNVLPIVERELRVQSRRPALHFVRLGAAAIALLITVSHLMARVVLTPSQSGQMMFHTMTMLAFVFAWMEGARNAADVLSSERREGTLGFLFLTNLQPHDVVLGKLAATTLNSLFALLAVLPVFGIVLLVGGISGGEVFRHSLVLIVTLFLSQAAGLWVSAGSREAIRAFFGALAILFFVTCLPVAEWAMRWGSLTRGNAWLSLLSPGYALQSATDTGYNMAGGRFWLSLLCIQSLSCLLLAGAAWRLKRSWRGDAAVAGPSVEAVQTSTSGGSTARSSRSAQLDRSPAGWLAGRLVRDRRMLWALIVLQAGTIILGISFFWLFWTMGVPTPSLGLRAPLTALFHFSVRLIIAFQACRLFMELRRSGAMELLLTTPLPILELVQGHWRALQRIWIAPILGLAVCELVLVLTLTLARGQHVAAGYQSVWRDVAHIVLTSFIPTVTGVVAVAWVGMWMGATSRNLVLAVTKTVALVVFVPWAVFSGLPIFWFLFPKISFFAIPPILSVLKDVAFVVLAQRQLRKAFGRMRSGGTSAASTAAA